MHKSDVKVLKTLAEKGCTTQLKSFSINQLLCDLNCSYSKAHNALNSLVIADFVSKGLKSSRAETYYITEKGLEKLRRLCQ